MVDASLTGPSRAAPSPIGEGERAHSMDVLRGFALLGILMPNIFHFALPQAAATDSTRIAEAAIIADPMAPDLDQFNAIGAWVMEVFFLGKFMFIFSLLFGAGVLFFDRKFAAQGERPRLSRGAGLWYARMGWLLLIGLVHAVALWYGDILVSYALVGLAALWWVRRWSPRTLIATGIAAYALGALLLLGVVVLGLWAVHAGHTDSIVPDPAQEIGTYRDGPYTSILLSRVGTLAVMYIFWLPMGTVMVSGLMLWGLALAKLGVLTGERPARFYAILAGIGLGLGLPLTILVREVLWSSGVPMPGFIWQVTAQWVGIPQAMGYVGLVVLATKTGALRPITAALGAVGRMALSNYLLQTIVCTTVFYSYGLGLFGTVQFPAIWGVVAAVWSVNILFSLFWLRFFRFGPAEWAWRSLTYLRPQPMLRHPQSIPGAAPA